VGKGQGAQGCFNRCPQRTHDVTSRPQEDCRSAEGALGKVAEGTQERLENNCETERLYQRLVASSRFFIADVQDSRRSAFCQ
jgi:hypothetical protein